MKTRILIYKDGNGKEIYRPQYKWLCFWIRVQVNILDLTEIPTEFDTLSAARDCIITLEHNKRKNKRIFVRRL